MLKNEGSYYSDFKFQLFTLKSIYTILEELLLNLPNIFPSSLNSLSVVINRFARASEELIGRLCSFGRSSIQKRAASFSLNDWLAINFNDWECGVLPSKSLRPLLAPQVVGMKENHTQHEF